MSYLRIVTFFFVCLTLAGCKSRCSQGTPQSTWMIPNGKLKVLSTTAMVHDVVQRVGGEHIDSLVLICGELDPHTYQLVKGDDEKLSFADIIFYNGLGLEHGPSLKHRLAASRKAVSLGDEVAKDHPDNILVRQGQLDPHIWMDMALWAKTIPVIVRTLSEADPKHHEAYEQNGHALAAELISTDNAIQQILQKVPDQKRYLVTSHDAFNYFARAYLATDEERRLKTWQLRFEAPEGLAPESQLSVSDIQAIITHLEKYHIHVLFPESNVSQDSIRKVVSAGNERGLQLRIADVPLYGDAMGEKGSPAGTYQGMLLHNAQVITDHINGGAQ